jgi:hypothetical protein
VAALLVLAAALLLAPGCRSSEPAPPPSPAPSAKDGELRCVVCGEPITGREVEIGGRHYHPSCYDLGGARCAICGEVIHGSYVMLGEGFEYHTSCWDSAPRCEGCGLPAAGKRGPATRWKDGRVTCAVCRREAVLDAGDAAKVESEARSLVERELGLSFGKIEVPVKLVSRSELLAEAQDVGQPAIKALTVAREEAPASDGTRGKRSYRIAVLYGLPRPLLVGILGHELFHVLQMESSSADRDPAFREGSANFVEVIVLRARGEETRARLLERDTDPIYGEGLRRFERLVAARGRAEALRLGVSSIAFPEGY